MSVCRETIFAIRLPGLQVVWDVEIDIFMLYSGGELLPVSSDVDGQYKLCTTEIELNNIPTRHIIFIDLFHSILK